MKFTTRDITKEEHTEILDDFRKIEIEYGILEASPKRLNVTVDEGGKVVGFASGLIRHKWFYLSDLWIHEKYRIQGLGAKILRMLEEDVKKHGIEHMYTWTTGYNSNEVFYEKQGYRQCLVFEDFFEVKDGHHICLIKDLHQKDTHR